MERVCEAGLHARVMKVMELSCRVLFDFTEMLALEMGFPDTLQIKVYFCLEVL